MSNSEIPCRPRLEILWLACGTRWNALLVRLGNFSWTDVQDLYREALGVPHGTHLVTEDCLLDETERFQGWL